MNFYVQDRGLSHKIMAYMFMQTYWRLGLTDPTDEADATLPPEVGSTMGAVQVQPMGAVFEDMRQRGTELRQFTGIGDLLQRSLNIWSGNNVFSRVVSRLVPNKKPAPIAEAPA